MSFRRCFIVTALLILVVAARSLPADEPDDRWKAAAAERIEKHRKADATITVVDQAGAPVADAKMAVEQVRHEFLFGCNFFQFDKYRTDAEKEAYCTQFASLFNYATLAFYWPSYEWVQGRPNREYTQRAAQWCRDHGIAVKGHPLAWNYSEPRWLPDDLDEVRRLQLQRVTRCVTEYRGLIDRWDVVNEATHFNRDDLRRRAPKLTRMWEETGRVEFVDLCFEAARHANPDATLLINDYRVDPEYAKVIERMAKVDGKRAYDVIGIQSHMHQGTWTNAKLWGVCERFATFGVPLHFTELTILSGKNGWELPRPWASTPDGEQLQAEEVERVYTELFSHPAVTAITWWDFADRGAWQGAPAGLLNTDLQPKPAYHVLHNLIKDQWWTRLEKRTDAQGQVAFRGYLGDYRVKVTAPSGKVVQFDVTLVRDAPNELKFQLD